MPRIIDAQGEPCDFCRWCMPSQGQAHTMGLTRGHTQTDQPSLYEYDAFHIAYGNGERCIWCDAELTQEDS